MTAEERYFPSTDFKIPRTSRFLFVITILLTVADIIYRKLNERALQPRIAQQIYNTHSPMNQLNLPSNLMFFLFSFYIVGILLFFLLVIKNHKKKDIRNLLSRIKLLLNGLLFLILPSSLTYSPSIYRTLFENVVAPFGYSFSPVILDWSVSLVGFIFSAGKLLALMSAINSLPPTFMMSKFHIVNTKYDDHNKMMI